MKNIIFLRIITSPLFFIGYLLFSLTPSPCDGTPLDSLLKKLWGKKALAKVSKARNPRNTYIVVENGKMSVY